MTTLMSSTNNALPKISYVKSIDSFIGTCFVMVFATLLEYATVSYLDKRMQARRAHFAALQKTADELAAAAEKQRNSRRRSMQVEKAADGAERVRLLIPGNPNQIFGMNPADIDKYQWQSIHQILLLNFTLYLPMRNRRCRALEMLNLDWNTMSIGSLEQFCHTFKAIIPGM